MKKIFCEDRYKAQQLCLDDITTYLMKSKTFLDSGKFEESIQVLSEVLEIEPGNKEAANRMAISYKNLEMWDKVVTWYNKLLLINPDEKETIIKDIITCQIENKNLEEAQKILTPLYKETPDDYFVVWLQANIYLKSGKREDAYIELYKAKTLLEKEISFNDKNDVALEILSMICALFFEFREARKYIEMACHISNNRVRRIKWLETFNLCKSMDEAHNTFATWHSLMVKDGKIRFDEILSDLQTDLEFYEKLDSDSLAVQYQLMNLYFCIACLYLKREQYAEALPAIEKAYEIFPIEPYYLMYKVIILHANGRYKETLSCIEYGKKIGYCVQFHEDFEEIRVQIISEHPELS